ncbi:MAG: sugar ABC transporter substrate-binding protein [Anaerolineaceae bacterium]|nr:MAG: sugar ABC transporter substrate-binding protein [Anaerolineaceae bacterium]
MRVVRYLIVLALISALGMTTITAQDDPQPGEPEWFASQCQPEDEGVVVPVDIMPEEPLRIAVLGLENNPFWFPVKEGTETAAAILAEYNTTVDWIIPGDTHMADDFSGGIEAAIVQGYDAIATIAGDAGLVPFINDAVSEGIPVATFNSETDAPNDRLFFVGADLYLQGQAAAAAMAEAIGGEGKVGVITGFFSVEAHELRRRGFVDEIAENYPDIEIVSEVENLDQGDTAYTQAQNFMTAHPDLSGIYVTAGGPFGAAAAVRDAGMAGEVWVISFDFVDETMEFVESGVIYATIGQNPFAQGHDPAIRLFNYLVAGEVPPCARLVTEAAIVTAENIYDFWTPRDGALPAAVQDIAPGDPDWFTSQCQPADEGVVMPVDMMPEEPLRIAVLGLENNPFWFPVKEGTETAAAILAEYNTTVDWIIPGDTHMADDFSGGIEAAIVQGYDAIATIAGDAGLVPFINDAVSEGIPVATFNSETDAPNDRLFFVGADLYLQGQAAAAAMAEAIGGEGKVGVITGFFSVEAHELRRRGFVDEIAENYPDIEIVSEVENLDQGDTAYTQAQNFMTAHPDLSGIYVTAGGPFGAAAAVRDAGMAGEVWVISFDFVDETMEFVESGVIYATIGQNPFAQGHDPAIRLFNYLVAGEVPPCARLVTEASIVTAENISEFWTP